MNYTKPINTIRWLNADSSNDKERGIFCGFCALNDWFI